MNFNDLSDKEKKKYLDGFKQYVAERQGKKVESNEVINSVIDDMYNGTNTREKYFNNNATNNNNDNSIWNKVQNTANNNMTNSNPFNGNDILSRRINGQNKTETQNLLNSTSNNNQTFSDELIKDLASIENIGERTNKIRSLIKDKDEQSKLILKVNEYIQQQESQEEAQKINSDIQQGNYLSSIGHVLKGIPEEAKNSVIDTVAAIQSIAPAPKTSNTANPERLVDAAKIATNKYQDTTSQIDNGVVQTASNISGKIGQMVPVILANIIAPGSGNLVQAVNVGTSSYLDTLNENQDNKAQAALTGVLKGTTSYGIEKITGGNFLGGGSLDDVAKKTIKSKFSSNIGRRIASKVYEIGGETLEENLENQTGYVIDKLVNNKDITGEQWLNDLGTTSRDTILTTIVLNLFGLGGNTYKEIQNDENIDSNTKELVKKAEKIIKDENLSVDNVNQTRTVETTNSQNNIDNNENVRTDNIFQQQNQNNIDTSNLNFEDSAKAYNLDTNNETIKTVNQVLSNRDISGRFDASYFNNNNENAIWKTSTDENGNTTREVIFNPNGNTQDTMQQISIHELTHDLAGTKEFDELKNLVLDRNKTMQGYTEARQSLENTYSQVYDPNSKEFKSLVDDEEVADTLAQKLGDQDFVNSLSTEKPTVFKRIYDWVVDKVNKITGNKIEKVYWEDIRNKFENAYRQTYQGESNQAKYSIQEDSSGNQYVRVDTDQDIFNGIDKKDYNKIAKMYIQDYLMGKTKLSDNDTAIIDRKSANKYTNPGKRQQNFDKKMKLTPELKNVLEIAQKDSSSLPIKNNSKYRNWEYYNFNFELSGKKFNGTVNIGIDSNGNKHFYEINKIKEVDDISGTSLNRSSASLSNNSITPSQDNVNTINKSMQNNENNTSNNNKNIKHSINSNSTWQEFLDNQIGQRGEGKTVQELRLPTRETINNDKVNSYNVLYKNNEQTSTMNLPVSEGGKVRKHYKSIMQSSNTSPEAKAIAKELMGTDTYVPDSNARQLEIADGRIERNGADNEAVALATKVKNGDKITAADIATGERLIEYYSKIGDKEKLQDNIQNVALAGTQLGQAVQAMSLVNRQTPQGQAVYLQKVIDRMNNDIDKRTKGKGKKFELTPEMIEKITNSSKENLESNIDEVAKELANQVPKTTIEKIDSWRYFSMLGNPKTHIRNVLGNLSMGTVQTVKNKVAGGLEAIAQKTGMIDKRTKTLKPASRETRKFAKADVDNVMARLNNESKFDAKNLIQQYQRTFKSNLLENTLGKLYNLNSKALEVEDVFGLKRAYQKSLADYMTANKLTEADLTAGTREADIQLEKARKYAIEQAQEATFHQQSAMASMLNTFENKSTAARLITGAVVPFKKTPINVAKTGASYSPLGLVKSFTLDVANLKNGKITANQYIDNLAKGLTGTGITAVGYALAQAGILSASGDEDDQKNQYYQEDRGSQPFSITIGDKTYSLDWLAPTAIPLFIGAELNYNVNNSNEEQTIEDVMDRISNGIDAMSSAMNPMIEMSMLSGLASTIKGFAQGDADVWQNLMINAGKSYVNQFFPTLGGQLAKIVDDTERSTTSTKKNNFAKAVDSTGKQILNKIPFASQLLPAKTDVWGNTLKRDSNPLYRALQQTTFPWTEKKLKSTNVDNAISDLYEETGEKSVLPNTSINKDFTLNGEKYRMTSEEYAEYKKQYGKNSYNLLNGLTSSKEYKSMNNEQKTEAISKIYEYANEKNKVDYANKKKVDIETSSLYNTVTSIEKEGGKGSDYFKYLGRITGVEKSEEKIKILEETDIPLKSKSSIYTNTVGKSDDFYSNVLKESDININEYLKYKQQKFESDKKDDGTLEGKTITNSKKKKVYNYVNNMNITYNQKLLILGKQYKLSDSEQKKLYQYINSIPGQTSKEKLEIFKMYTNNFQIYKNGTMSFK